MFDHVNKSQRFLGLGIVGVEEFLANPSQRQIIPLQARPYEEDDITGTLTVEVTVLIQFHRIFILLDIKRDIFLNKIFL